jgi:hypothetical protein
MASLSNKNNRAEIIKDKPSVKKENTPREQKRNRK